MQAWEDISVYLLNTVRADVTAGHGMIRVHGNKLASVQGHRAAMLSVLLVQCDPLTGFTARSAIQSVLYTDEVKMDEERVQTGAVFVNMTKDSVVQEAVPKLERMWLLGQLPTGDIRSRENPPSERLIRAALESLRTGYGDDIYFARDSSDW